MHWGITSISEGVGTNQQIQGKPDAKRAAQPPILPVPLDSAGLLREKSTAGWLVAGLLREKSTAGWWLISQANRSINPRNHPFHIHSIRTKNKRQRDSVGRQPLLHRWPAGRTPPGWLMPPLRQSHYWALTTTSEVTSSSSRSTFKQFANRDPHTHIVVRQAHACYTCAPGKYRAPHLLYTYQSSFRYIYTLQSIYYK
jgi:hypothetical protein